MQSENFSMEYEADLAMESIGGQFGESAESVESHVDFNDNEAPDLTVDEWMDNDPPWAGNPLSGSHVKGLGLLSSQGGYDPLPPRSALDDWRSNPAIPSECGTFPNDSGYAGSRAPCPENYSAYGEDYGSASLPDLDFINISLVADDMDPRQYPTPELQPDQQSVSRNPDDKWYCRHCQLSMKTKSEFNKHKQRHEKPYRCHYDGCPKAVTGFASQGDLMRHRKSVHKEYSLGGHAYYCRHSPCDNKGKVWPRADNFRSHLQRMHGVIKSPDDDLSYYHAGDSVHVQTAQPEESLDQPTSGDQYTASPGQKAFSVAPVLTGMAAQFPTTAGMPTDDELLPSPATIPSARTTSMHLQTTGYYSNVHCTTSQSPQTPLRRAKAEPADLSQTGFTGIMKSESASPQIPGPPSYASTPSLSSQGAVSPHTRPQQTQARVDPNLTPTTTNHTIRHYESVFSEIPDELLDSLIEKRKCKSAEQSREPSSTPSRPETVCSYEGCNKAFDMPCKLRKHMKRHEKPYGCTRPLCVGTFGSKNDWKRHEGSQHDQPEVWRCSLECGKVFQSRDDFKAHLGNEHDISTEPALNERITGDQLRKHFWCGFCFEVINGEPPEASNPSGTYADPRFDHIDDHYMGRNNLPKRVTADWRDANTDPSRLNFKRPGSPPNLKRKGSSNLQHPRFKHAVGNRQK